MAAHHPRTPPELEQAVATLVERCGRCVAEALPGAELPSPAWSLCLFPSDDGEGLAPANVALGLEADRELALAGDSPFAVFDDAWNPTLYTHISLDEFEDPAGEPDWDAASVPVRAWLGEEGVGDPAFWLLEEVAARLTRTPPVAPASGEFACWVFAQGDQLIESLRWILPAETQDALAAEGLLVDDPDGLAGARPAG